MAVWYHLSMQTDSPIPLHTPSFETYVSRRRGIIIVCVIFFISIVALFFNEIYVPHAQFIGTRTIEIPPGLGSRMIAGKLKTEGFIRSKWAFVTYVILRGKASYLKPGAYEFTNASIPQIARALADGTSREVIITLTEGATTNDLARVLTDQQLSAGATFTQFATGIEARDFHQKYPFLKSASIASGLEGYLFPDTYHIFKDASPRDIADIFLQNFDKKITPDMRDEIMRSGKILHDIIIMASLIEKEVVPDEDRKIVSGILLNRLRIDMPLQVDATISYIKKQNNSPLSADGRPLGEPRPVAGRISLADLALNSPYNTYKYRGLPAGPIGNPGLSAILAAIHPTSSGYLYYLSAPDGRTIYSKTLTEHNAAKLKYLR